MWYLQLHTFSINIKQMYVHCNPSMEGTYIYVSFPQKVVEQLRGCLLSTKPVDRHRHSDVELTISPLSATFSAGRLPATFQASDSSKLGFHDFHNPKVLPHNQTNILAQQSLRSPDNEAFKGIHFAKNRSQSPTCKAFQLDDLTTWILGPLQSYDPNHLALGQLYEYTTQT